MLMCVASIHHDADYVISFGIGGVYMLMLSKEKYL